MNKDLKKFYEHYNKLNDKETEKNWCYGEDYTFVEHYEGKQEIPFLDKFIKVFKDYPLWTIIVDYNIWFVHDDEVVYIWEEFLDFCLENKLFSDKAYRFYHHNLEENSWDVDYIEYKESLLTYKRDE
jgi:hypothetical protein